MLTLFMVQLGGRPKGRLIEQHDIFFGVANEVSELIDDIIIIGLKSEINGILILTERLAKSIIIVSNWLSQAIK